jgi:hypothetical protein
MKMIKILLLLCIIVVCCYGAYNVTNDLRGIEELDGTITLTKKHPYGGPFKLDTIKNKTVVLTRGTRSKKNYTISENETYSFDKEKFQKGYVKVTNITKDSVTLTGKVKHVKEGSYWMVIGLFFLLFLYLFERLYSFIEYYKKQAN